jgi:hypothetical protein
MDDLTFRERRKVRSLARELDGNPDVDFDDLVLDDLIAAFVTVCKQRTTPDFTIDEALDLKPTDLSAVAVDPPTPLVAKANGAAKRSAKTP